VKERGSARPRVTRVAMAAMILFEKIIMIKERKLRVGV
jgi:hypothetical protein